jgi:hypothetical protein
MMADKWLIQCCPYCFSQIMGPLICCDRYYQNAGDKGFRYLTEEEASIKRKKRYASLGINRKEGA